MKQTKEQPAEAKAPETAAPETVKPVKPATAAQTYDLDHRQPLCILNGNRLVYAGPAPRKITLNLPQTSGREVEK